MSICFIVCHLVDLTCGLQNACWSFDKLALASSGAGTAVADATVVDDLADVCSLI